MATGSVALETNLQAAEASPGAGGLWLGDGTSPWPRKGGVCPGAQTQDFPQPQPP